jgi:hypothetical protein
MRSRSEVKLDDKLLVSEKIGELLVVIGVPGKSPGEVPRHLSEHKLRVVGDTAIVILSGRLAFRAGR